MGSNRWLRNSLVYLLVIIGVIVVFYTFLPSFGGRDERPISTVIRMAENHEIREILVDGKAVPSIGNEGIVRRGVELDADKLKAGTAVSE